MKIVIAADHGGVNLKASLVEYLQEQGLTVEDLGGFDPQADDSYSDEADKVVEKVLANEADWGIIVCGSGIGVSIRANRHKGIRAALVHNTQTAGMAKQHNNVNVLCFGERVIWACEGGVHGCLQRPGGKIRICRRVCQWCA